MTEIVLDASVAIKLFLPESGSEHARRLFRQRVQCIAPDLIWAEIASVLWKRVRAGEISADRSIEILNEALRFPIRTVSNRALAASALEVAVASRRSVYDSLYIALAVSRSCRVVTADRRLVNALAKGPFGNCVRLLGME